MPNHKSSHLKGKDNNAEGSPSVKWTPLSCKKCNQVIDGRNLTTVCQETWTSVCCAWAGFCRTVINLEIRVFPMMHCFQAVTPLSSFFTRHKVAGGQKIIKETLENPLKYSFSISLSTGIKVIGGVKELTGEEFGVYVKRILPGGLASTDGKTWNPETFGQTVLEQQSLNLD